MQSMEFSEDGPLLDRNWMIVDESGRFVTQRELPEMALIRPEWKNGNLYLHGRESTMEVNEESELKQVTVWKHSLNASTAHRKCNEWISRELGAPLTLVKMHEPRINNNIPVRFSDAYPVLVCNQRSLDDLNGRLPEPVPMSRFRANIVVRAESPWEEDRWKALECSGVSFQVEKPCSRCSIITVDSQRGTFHKEPLKTLALFRRFENKVHFGMYCSVKNAGQLTVGMRLQAGFL